MRVSFTAFHRTDYWEQSLESWARVRGIEGADISVFLESSGFRDEMTEIATRILPQTVVHQNEVRLGVSKNPWVAMDDAFSTGEDFAVLAEDDIIVSSDILEYFLWARDKFRWDPEVLAICSFDSHLESPGHTFGKGDVTKQRWFSPLVWGTWADRWENQIRDTWDFDYSYGGWDWNMRMGVMKDQWFCVFPRHSRSTHIGEFDGTHMQPEQFKETQAGTFVEERPRTRYRYAGYLDFWEGVLSATKSPYYPERSIPPSKGGFQSPVPVRGTPGSNPNFPLKKAVVGGQSFDYGKPSP